MTAEQRAYEAWSQRIADRVEHQDLCFTFGHNCCSAPFSTVIRYCPTGQRLADAEDAAYRAWRISRQGATVSHA